MVPSTRAHETVLLRHLAPRSGFRDDLYQEVAVRILVRLRSQAPPTLSRAYVRRTARTAAIDGARQHDRRQRLLETHARALRWASDPQDPERQLHARHIKQAIEDELGRLSPERRELLTLFLDGHGITELAGRKGVDRKRVENGVYRSLSKVRKGLRDRGLGPESVLRG
ncbi:MAG: RNA polymerase sigma factor [Nannocystales bacterium]